MVVQSTGTISIDQIQEMRDKVVIVLLPETPYYVGPVFIPAVECNHSALNTLKQYKTSIIAIHIQHRTCSPAIEGFIVKYVSNCMNQYLCQYSPYTHLICSCSSIFLLISSFLYYICFCTISWSYPQSRIQTALHVLVKSAKLYNLHFHAEVATVVRLSHRLTLRSEKHDFRPTCCKKRVRCNLVDTVRWLHWNFTMSAN